jgi:hypothetical protein
VVRRGRGWSSAPPVRRRNFLLLRFRIFLFSIWLCATSLWSRFLCSSFVVLRPGDRRWWCFGFDVVGGVSVVFPIFSRHRRSLSFLSVSVSCCCRSRLYWLGSCWVSVFPADVVDFRRVWVVLRHGSGGLVSWW